MNLLYIALGNGINPAIAGSLARSGNIAKNLIKRGHNVTFITTSGGKKALESLGVSTTFILVPAWWGKEPSKERGKLDRIYSNLISLFGSLYKIFFNNQQSTINNHIIYTDSDYFFDIIPAVLIKIKKHCRFAPIIHHEISLNKQSFSAAFFSLLSVVVQKIDWLIIMLFADTILLYNTPMGKSIAKKLAPLAKLRKLEFNFINNGVDTEFIKKIAASKEKYSAVMVGGLRPSKGMYDIVPIWKKVCEKMPQATLAVIGAGLKEYTDWFENEIKKEGMEKNIYFLGAKDNKNALAHIKSSKVFFFPSREEGFGIAVAEALACETPVIAYNLPVYKNTFAPFIKTIPLWDKDRFAKETINLLENSSKVNATFLENFEWENIAKNEEKIFEKVTFFDRLPEIMHFSGRARFDFESFLYKKGIIQDIKNIAGLSPKGAKVLDIGCGKGHLAAYLSLYGFETYGIDLENLDGDQQQIKDPLWRQKYWNKFSQKYGVEYKTFKGLKIPFEDNSFDAISAYAVIEHVPESILNEWLCELHRVLKPEGRLFINRCPNKFSYSEKLAKILKMPSHEKLYTKNELQNLLLKHKFIIEKIGRSDFFIEFPPVKLNTIYNTFSPLLALVEKVIMPTPLKIVSHHLWAVAKKATSNYATTESEQTRKQVKYFDKEFSTYEKYNLANWQKSYFERISNYLNLDKSENFLDIGCGGMAYLVIEAAKKGAKAHGLDLSPEAIKKAEQFAKAEKVSNSTKFVQGSAEKLPFENEAFDAVSSTAVLEHLEHDTKAVKEIARVCKKGAKVYIVVPNAYINMPFYTWLPYYIHDKRIGHLRHYSGKSLSELFEKEGFKTLKTFTTGHNIKFAQLLIHRFYKNDSLWKKMEKKDLAQEKGAGVTLNAVFEKVN